MDRILGALTSSKYSIHDLSRCRGEGEERLARFNMPLELGIAMASRFIERTTDRRHDWLILVPDGHQYVRFISDLAGYDPERHDGTVESIVRSVVRWLQTRPDAVPAPTPRAILAALPAFMAEKERLVHEWGHEVPWGELLRAARRTAPSP